MPSLAQAEQEQQAAERSLARQQQQSSRQADRAAEDAAREAQRQQNDALESHYRSQGRPIYTDAHSNIQTVHSDEQWSQIQQDKANKAAAALDAKQQRAVAIQSGRRNQINPVDGTPIYLESEAAVQQRQQQAAEKLRQSAIDDQIKKTTAEYEYRKASENIPNALTDAQHATLNKKLDAAHQEGALALAGSLDPQTKAVSGGNDWIPFNESPTPAALAAKARQDTLSQPGTRLSESDLTALEQTESPPSQVGSSGFSPSPSGSSGVPASAGSGSGPPSIAKKIRNIQSILERDQTAQKFHTEHAQRLADLKLRQADPAKWAEFTAQRRAALPPAQLQSELQQSSQSITERTQQLKQQSAQIQQQRTTHTVQLDQLSQQAAERRAQGIPAGEIVAYKKPDGTVEHWPKDLAKQRETVQAQLQDTLAQQAPTIAAWESQSAELQRDITLHNDTVKLNNQKEQDAKLAAVEQLKQSPQTAKLGADIEALNAERDTRLADLHATHGDAIPPDALHALESDHQQRQQAIFQQVQSTAKEQQDTARAASIAYQRYGFDADLKDALPKVGLDPQNPAHVEAWWDARKRDFGGDENAYLPDDRPLAKTKGVDWSRTLSDGSIAVSPRLIQDPKRYAEAVALSSADPAAKAAAMADYPRLQLAQAESMIPMLTAMPNVPGIPSFAKWQKAQKQSSTSEAEQARDYLAAMNARGFWSKIGDTTARNLLAGFSDIGTQTVGSLAALTGSKTFSEAAAGWSRDASAFTAPLDAEGATKSLTGAVLGQTARMAGPMAAMLLVTRGLGSGLGPAAAIAASQTAGSQYAEAYNDLRTQGVSHDDAWKQTAPYALASGLVTAALTTAGGKIGAKAFLKTAADHEAAAAKAAAQGFWKHALTNVPKQMLGQTAEELPDELFSQVSQYLSTHPKAGTPEVSQVIGDFWKNSPSFLGSIMLMGGAGGAHESYQETRPLASTVNHRQPPSTTVNSANLPETSAAAIDAIENYFSNLPAEHQEAVKNRAQVALIIAQGGDMSDATEQQLNDTGWTARDSKGVQLPDGKLERLKDYTGPSVFTVDSTGRPTLDPSYRQKLQTELPAVYHAISESATQTQPQSDNPPARQTPAPGSGPNANQGPVQTPPVNGTQSPPSRNPAPQSSPSVASKKSEEQTAHDKWQAENDAFDAAYKATKPHSEERKLARQARHDWWDSSQGREPFNPLRPLASMPVFSNADAGAAFRIPEKAVNPGFDGHGTTGSQGQKLLHVSDENGEFSGWVEEHTLHPQQRALLEKNRRGKSPSSTGSSTAVPTDHASLSEWLVDRHMPDQEAAAAATAILAHPTMQGKDFAWFTKNISERNALFATLGISGDSRKSSNGTHPLRFSASTPSQVRSSGFSPSESEKSSKSAPSAATHAERLARAIATTQQKLDDSIPGTPEHTTLTNTLAKLQAKQSTEGSADTPVRSGSGSTHPPSTTVNAPSVPSATVNSPFSPKALNAALHAKEITDTDAANAVQQHTGASTVKDLTTALQDLLGWTNYQRALTAASTALNDKSQSPVPLAAAERSESSEASPSSVALAQGEAKDGKQASNRQPSPSTGAIPGPSVSAAQPPSTTVNAPQEPQQPSTSPVPTSLTKNGAWARAKLNTLSQIKDPAKKAWARQFFATIEEGFQRHHALYDAIGVGTYTKALLGGQMTAVINIEGKVTRLFDFSAMLAQFDYLADPRAAALATGIEEDIHAAVFHLGIVNPEKYGYDALVKQFDALPEALRQTVWNSYNASLHTQEQRHALPQKLSAAQNWHMMNEFLRMLVQDKHFAGQITESVDASTGLISWVQDLLRDLGKLLKDLLNSLSGPQRQHIESMVDEIADTLRHFEQASARTPTRTESLASLRDPAAVALQFLTSEARSAKDGPLFSPRALESIFDTFPPALKSFALQHWQQATSSAASSAASSPSKRAPKADLVRHLLSQLIGGGPTAKAINHLLLEPTAKPATSLLQKLLSLFSARTRAIPGTSERSESSEASAKDGIRRLHVATLRALGGLQGALFVQSIPRNSTTAHLLATPLPKDSKAAPTRWLTHQIDRATDIPPSNPPQARSSGFSPSDSPSGNPVNSENPVNPVQNSASGSPSKDGAADMLAAIAAAEAQDAQLHADAASPEAAGLLRAKLRLQELASIRARFFLRDNAARELHTAEQAGRQDLPKAQSMLALGTGTIGARRSAGAWRTVGWAERRQLALLGIGIDQYASEDAGGYPFSLSRREAAELRVEFSLEATPERQIAQDELDWMKSQPAGFQSAIDPLSPAYVERGIPILKQSALDDLALSYPHTSALIRPELEARQSFGLRVDNPAPTPKQAAEHDKPQSPYFNKPATLPALSGNLELRTGTPAGGTINSAPNQKGAAISPQGTSQGENSHAPQNKPVEIPITEDGTRGTLTVTFLTPADREAYLWQQNYKSIRTDAKLNQSAKDKLQQSNDALETRIMQLSPQDVKALRLKLAAYHQLVKDQAQKANDDKESSYTPPPFLAGSSSSSQSTSAKALPPPVGGDIISDISQFGMDHIGTKPTQGGELDALKAILDGIGKPNQTQIKATVAAMEKGDFFTPLARVLWLWGTKNPITGAELITSDVPSFKKYRRAGNVFAYNGKAPDVAADTFTRGVKAGTDGGTKYKFDSADELIQAILAAFENRIAALGQFNTDPALEGENDSQRQSQNFQSLLAGAQGRPMTGVEIAAALGDKLTDSSIENDIVIGNTIFTIQDFNPDFGLNLTASGEDSHLYGPQTLAPDQSAPITQINEQRITPPSTTVNNGQPRSTSSSAPSAGFKTPSAETAAALDRARANLQAALKEEGLTGLAASDRYTPEQIAQVKAEMQQNQTDAHYAGRSAWLTPENRWINLGPNEMHYDASALVHELGYGPAMQAGYVRIVQGENHRSGESGIYAEYFGPLTRRIIREVRDSAIEHGVAPDNVQFENAEKFYGTGPLSASPRIRLAAHDYAEAAAQHKQVRAFADFAQFVKQDLPALWPSLQPLLHGAWTAVANEHNLPETSRAQAAQAFASLAPKIETRFGEPDAATLRRMQALNEDSMNFSEAAPPAKAVAPATPEAPSPEGQMGFWNASHIDYRQETPHTPEGSPMSREKAKAIAPYLISGNKGDLVGLHGQFYLDLARDSNSVIDAFGGAAIYTHFLGSQNALTPGSVWNEWEFSRAVTNRQIQQSPAAVVREVIAVRTLYSQAFPKDTLPATYQGMLDKRTEILNWINQQLEDAIPARTLDDMGRLAIPDTPRSAALYLFLQSHMTEGRVTDFDLNEQGLPRCFTSGKENGKDDFQFISSQNINTPKTTPDEDSAENTLEDSTATAPPVDMTNAVISWEQPWRIFSDKLPGLIREASMRLQQTSVRHGDGWQLAADAPKDALVFVDTSYFPSDDQIAGGKKVMNYGKTTLSDGNPLKWFSKFKHYLLDKGHDVRYVITNNFNSQVVELLEQAGWSVLQSYRGSPKKPSYELIALSPAAAAAIQLRPARARRYFPGGLPRSNSGLDPAISGGTTGSEPGLPAGEPRQTGKRDPQSGLRTPALDHTLEHVPGQAENALDSARLSYELDEDPRAFRDFERSLEDSLPDSVSLADLEDALGHDADRYLGHKDADSARLDAGHRRPQDGYAPAVRFEGHVATAPGSQHFDALIDLVAKHKIPAWMRNDADARKLAINWIRDNSAQLEKDYTEGFNTPQGFMDRKEALASLRSQGFKRGNDVYGLTSADIAPPYSQPELLAAAERQSPTGPTFPNLVKPTLPAPRPRPELFNEWAASTSNNNLYGYRGEIAGKTKANGFGNTEGNGIYLMRKAGEAAVFGRVRRVEFPEPTAPFLIDDGELHLLHESDALDQPITAQDTPWLQACKYATQHAHNLGNGQWNQQLAGDILTTLLIEAGYDSTYVKGAPDDWVVLLRAARPGQQSLGALPAGGRLQEAQAYLDLPDVNVPTPKRPAATATVTAVLDHAADSAAAPTPRSDVRTPRGADRNGERLQKLRLAAERAFRGLMNRDPAVIAEAFQSGDTISSLLQQFINRDIPGFDIRGAVISHPADFAAFNQAIRSPFFESVKIAVLGDGNQVIHSQIVHVGALGQSIFSPARVLEIIDSARLQNPKQQVSGFLIAHNHPSSNPLPSDTDLRITTRLQKLANTIGENFIDHVITNGESYFSFKESGLMFLPRDGSASSLSHPIRARGPKLPVLPTPARPATGNMAAYEAVPASSAPSLNTPHGFTPYIAALKTADPDHHHVIYTDTRGQMRAVERLPQTLETSETRRRIAYTSAREGAAGVFVAYAPPTTPTQSGNIIAEPNPYNAPATPSDAQRRLTRELKLFIENLGAINFDAFATSRAPNGTLNTFSFLEHGLAASDRQFSNPASILPAAPRRAYQSMTFTPPFHTSFGDIVSYHWASKPLGGMDSHRTSDWDQARTNAVTGRDIVHHFKVQKPDGMHTVSLETALGQLTQAQKSKLTSLIKSEQRRQQDSHTGQLALFAAPREVEPGFYSRLERILDTKLPATGNTPAQILGLLTNNAVKQDEIKWSGLLPWLQQQAKVAPISKAALLDYLHNQGAVKFAEQKMGENSTPVWRVRDTQTFEMFESEAAAAAAREDWIETFVSDGYTRKEAENEVKVTEEAGEPKFPTRYDRYQLPGGQNYREVVVTMPVKDRDIAEADIEAQAEVDAGSKWESFNRLQRIAAIEGVRSRFNKSDDYTSSHFSDIPNYLAHYRANDRTDTTGRPGTLLEELQSDRHQQGREKGYQGLTEQEQDRAAALKAKPFSEWSSPDTDWYNATVNDRQDNGIPDAPFRTTWPLMLFKRALREAVETGQQWIGWTTGETQNNRYPDEDRGDGGMIGFYDSILPKEIGKYVKQWGASVQHGYLRPGKGLEQMSNDDAITGTAIGARPIWRINITPAMRDSVASGQPLFASNRKVSQLQPQSKKSLSQVSQGEEVSQVELANQPILLLQRGRSQNQIERADKSPLAGEVVATTTPVETGNPKPQGLSLNDLLEQYNAAKTASQSGIADRIWRAKTDLEPLQRKIQEATAKLAREPRASSTGHFLAHNEAINSITIQRPDGVQEKMNVASFVSQFQTIPPLPEGFHLVQRTSAQRNEGGKWYVQNPQGEAVSGSLPTEKQAHANYWTRIARSLPDRRAQSDMDHLGLLRFLADPNQPNYHATGLALKNLSGVDLDDTVDTYTNYLDDLLSDLKKAASTHHIELLGFQIGGHTGSIPHMVPTLSNQWNGGGTVIGDTGAAGRWRSQQKLDRATEEKNTAEENLQKLQEEMSALVSHADELQRQLKAPLLAYLKVNQEGGETVDSLPVRVIQALNNFIDHSDPEWTGVIDGFDANKKLKYLENRPITNSGLAEPAWLKEQSERTELLSKGASSRLYSDQRLDEKRQSTLDRSLQKVAQYAPSAAEVDRHALQRETLISQGANPEIYPESLLRSRIESVASEAAKQYLSAEAKQQQEHLDALNRQWMPQWFPYHVPPQPAATAQWWQDLMAERDVEERKPAQTFISKVWHAIAQHDEAFSYGRTTSGSSSAIAKTVSNPGKLVTMTNSGDTVRVMGANGYLDIHKADTDHPYIRSTAASSQGKKGGGGTQIYQAALDWIHNNGKQIKNDPGGLSSINAIRRTSNFFSSALRWRTTKHLKPHSSQGVPWSKSPALNTAALATKEMDNAFKAVAEAQEWQYDFDRDEFLDASGQPLSHGRIEHAVLVSDPAKTGIGLSTLQRAVITRSALEAFKSGTAPGVISSLGNRESLPDRLTGFLYASARSAPSVALAKDGPLESATSRHAATLEHAAATLRGEGSLAPGLRSMFHPQAKTPASGQRGLFTLPPERPVLHSFSEGGSESSVARSAQDGPLLSHAYSLATQGRTSEMVPIKTVWHHAQTLDPSLTPAAFMRALKAGDDSGSILLGVYDTPAQLDAARPFVLKNASGVPAINMAMEAPSILPASRRDPLALAGSVGKALVHGTAKAAIAPFALAGKLAELTGLDRPLAAFGSNNLDKRVAAALARVAGPKVTSAKQAAEAWLQQPDGLSPTIKGFVDQLLPNALMPREWLALKHEMDRKSAFGAERANDLIRALSGNPRLSDLAYPPEFAQNPIHRVQLFDAMEGRIPMDSLPPAMQQLATRLRSLLNDTGSELVKQGLMNPDTFEELQSSGWMPRYTEEEAQAAGGSFLAAFKLGIRDLNQQRSTAFHIVDTTRRDKTGQYLTVNREEGGKRNRWRFRDAASRDAYYSHLIRDQALKALQDGGQSLQQMLAPLSRSDREAMRSQIKSLTLDTMSTPQALSPMLRGIVKQSVEAQKARFDKADPFLPDKLVKDPVYAVARYVLGQSHNAATMELMRSTAANPDWVTDVDTQGFQKIPDNSRFGPLAGKFLKDDIARQVLDLVDVPNAALKAYDSLLRKWKAGKLVWNPGSHIRDAVGNSMFAYLGGNSIWNPGNWQHYRNAMAVLRTGSTQGAGLAKSLLDSPTTYAELIEHAVLGGDAYSGMVKERLKGLLPDAKTIEDFNPGLLQRTLMGFGSAFHGTHEFLSECRRFPDDFYKVAAYLRYKEQGMDAATAAAEVRKWFPYYDRLGQSATTRAWGRGINPFLSFFRESTRILATAAAERPLALASSLAFPAAISALSAMLLSLDDRDRDEIHKDLSGRGLGILGLGNTHLFSMLLPVHSGQGTPQQWDISAVMPFADFLGQKVVPLEEKENALQTYIRRLMTGGPVMGLAYAWGTNQDTFSGRHLVENDMGTREMAGALAQHALGVIAPPLAPDALHAIGIGDGGPLSKMGDRQTNKTLQTYDPVQTILRTVFGMNVKSAAPNLYRQADDFRRSQGMDVNSGFDYGTTATSRVKRALVQQLAQDQPNKVAIKNIVKHLKDLGVPLDTPKQIDALVKIIDPAQIIGGSQKLKISAETARQKFRASLPPESRSLYETSLREYQKIKSRAPMLLR